MPEEKYFNALVRGAVASGRLEDAEAVLQKMHNDVLNLELVSRRGGSLPPSALTYGTPRPRRARLCCVLTRACAPLQAW
jgi:pentatricopeptide repeat protein